MRTLLVTVATVVALACPQARAQTVLRMATIAPEGTAWAREIKTFARAVEAETKEQVRIKIYFGGIAGDELQVGERIRRDQLDGAFSGGMLCQRLAPSMRVSRIIGLFQGREELAHVMGRLKPTIDEEFRKSGFVNLGLVGVGPELIFIRKPIATLAELKAITLWTWDVDNILGPGLDGIGFHTVHASIEKAGPMYDEGKVDGFIAVPAAALAFQWSAQARYLVPLRLAMLDACVILTNRSFDPLPEEHKAIVRHAAARGIGHLEEASRAQDDALIGGLFAKQGLQKIKISPQLRSEFFDEARAWRDRMLDQLVPRALLERALALLADYRAEHREGDSF